MNVNSAKRKKTGKVPKVEESVTDQITISFISLHVFGSEGSTCFQDQSQTIRTSKPSTILGLVSFNNQLKIALDAISNHTVLKKVPNTGY